MHCEALPQHCTLVTHITPFPGLYNMSENHCNIEMLRALCGCLATALYRLLNVTTGVFGVRTHRAFIASLFIIVSTRLVQGNDFSSFRSVGLIRCRGYRLHAHKPQVSVHTPHSLQQDEMTDIASISNPCLAGPVASGYFPGATMIYKSMRISRRSYHALSLKLVDGSRWEDCG